MSALVVGGAGMEGRLPALPGIRSERLDLTDRPFLPRGDKAVLQQTTPHSITSPARASNVGGTVRLSAFAALRLITSSNLVGWSIGRSAGLAPFKILPTRVAERRVTTAASGPYEISPRPPRTTA